MAGDNYGQNDYTAYNPAPHLQIKTPYSTRTQINEQSGMFNFRNIPVRVDVYNEQLYADPSQAPLGSRKVAKISSQASNTQLKGIEKIFAPYGIFDFEFAA